MQPIGIETAKLARYAIYRDGTVQATVMKGSEPATTRLVQLRKQRGQFLWLGEELGSGAEYEVVSVCI